MNDEPKNEPELKKEMVEKDQHLRLAADFENYRKDVSNKIAAASDFGKGTVINDVLDIMDAFDAARVQKEWTEGLELAVIKLDQIHWLISMGN